MLKLVLLSSLSLCFSRVIRYTFETAGTNLNKKLCFIYTFILVSYIKRLYKFIDKPCQNQGKKRVLVASVYHRARLFLWLMSHFRAI